MRLILLPEKTSICDIYNTDRPDEMPYFMGNVLDFVVEMYGALAQSLGETLHTYIATTKVRESSDYQRFSSIDELESLEEYKNNKSFTIVTGWFNLPSTGINKELIEECRQKEGKLFPCIGGYFGYVDGVTQEMDESKSHSNIVKTIDATNFHDLTREALSLVNELSLESENPRGSGNTMYGNSYLYDVLMNNTVLYGDNHIVHTDVLESQITTPSIILKSNLRQCRIRDSIVINSELTGSDLDGAIVINSVVYRKTLNPRTRMVGAMLT